MAATLLSLKAELKTILDQEDSAFEEYNLVHDSMNHYDLRLIVPVGQAKPSAEFLPRMESHLLHCLQKKLQPLTERRDELLRLVSVLYTWCLWQVSGVVRLIVVQIGEMEREEKFGVGFRHREVAAGKGGQTVGKNEEDEGGEGGREEERGRR